MSDEPLVFLDIETTGLNKKEDSILEIYAAKVKSWTDLTITDEFHQVGYYSLEENKDVLSDFIIKMHTKNGLWDDCLKSNIQIPDMLINFHRWLLPFTEHGKVLLGGNSVGSFDHPFLMEAYPNFNSVLSHRVLDVSSMYRALRKIRPVKYPPIGTAADSTHRAKDDILENTIPTYQKILDVTG